MVSIFLISHTIAQGLGGIYDHPQELCLSQGLYQRLSIIQRSSQSLNGTHELAQGHTGFRAFTMVSVSPRACHMFSLEVSAIPVVSVAQVLPKRLLVVHFYSQSIHVVVPLPRTESMAFTQVKWYLEPSPEF